MLDISSVGEAILNPDFYEGPLKGFRMYRYEYGGHAQECLFEGRLLVPAHADPEAVSQLLMGMQWQEENTHWGDDRGDV
jgi:hypothetical protein